MNNAEQRTLSIFKELDDLLNMHMIDADDTTIDKIGNTLKWINSNLNKTDLFDFLNANQHSFEHFDVMKELLNQPEFNPHTYH